MPSQKRSQAAMEFLMTYGWALLAVMIIVGALSYFGVWDPRTILPDKCEGSPELGCTDFAFGKDTIALSLINGVGEAITLKNATFSGQKLDACTWAGPVLLPNTGRWTLLAWGCNFQETGKKISVSAKVVYSKSSSSFDRFTQIDLKGRVGTDSLIDFEAICQEAEDNGLCDGLDILFGQGFKDMCWTEYSLCPP